jgi:hypothetical protein
MFGRKGKAEEKGPATAQLAGRHAETVGFPFARVDEEAVGGGNFQRVPTTSVHAANVGKIVFSKTNVTQAGELTDTFGPDDHITACMFLQKPLCCYGFAKDKWLCDQQGYCIQGGEHPDLDFFFVYKLLFSFEINGKPYVPLLKPAPFYGKESYSDQQPIREQLQTGLAKTGKHAAFIWNIANAGAVFLEGRQKSTPPAYWSVFPIFLYPGIDTEWKFVEQYRETFVWPFVELLKTLEPGGSYRISITCTVGVVETQMEPDRKRKNREIPRKIIAKRDYYAPICSGSFMLHQRPAVINKFLRLLPVDFGPTRTKEEREALRSVLEQAIMMEDKIRKQHFNLEAPLKSVRLIILGWVEDWHKAYIAEHVEFIGNKAYLTPAEVYIACYVWAVFDHNEPETEDPQLPVYCFHCKKFPNSSITEEMVLEDQLKHFGYEVRRSVARSGQTDYQLVDMLRSYDSDRELPKAVLAKPNAAVTSGTQSSATSPAAPAIRGPASANTGTQSSAVFPLIPVVKAAPAVPPRLSSGLTRRISAETTEKKVPRGWEPDTEYEKVTWRNKFSNLSEEERFAYYKRYEASKAQRQFDKSVMRTKGPPLNPEEEERKRFLIKQEEIANERERWQGKAREVEFKKERIKQKAEERQRSKDEAREAELEKERITREEESSDSRRLEDEAREAERENSEGPGGPAPPPPVPSVSAAPKSFQRRVVAPRPEDAAVCDECQITGGHLTKCSKFPKPSRSK